MGENISSFNAKTQTTAKNVAQLKSEKTFWQNVKSEAKATGKFWYNGIKNSDLADCLRGDFKSAASKWKNGVLNSDIAHFMRGDFKGGAKIVAESNRDWEQGLGLNVVKNPVKQEFKKLEAKVNDGNDNNLTKGEKAVEVAKTVGKVVDTMTTPLGIATTALTGAALSGAATAAKAGIVKASTTLAAQGATKSAAVVASIPAATSVTAMVGGTATAAVGAGQIIKADTKEEVKSGTNKVILGTGVAAMGAAMAGPSVEVAKAAGVPVNDNSSAIAQVFSIPAKAVTTPTSELQANALSEATGVLQAGSTALEKGFENITARKDNLLACKFDHNHTGKYDNLGYHYYADHPQHWEKNKDGVLEMVYDKVQRKGFDPKKDYMILYRRDCSDSYKFDDMNEFSRKYLIDPSKLKPGKNIGVYAAPAKFKFLKPGTKFVTEKGIETMHRNNVLMSDQKGIYQNPIANLVRDYTGFSDGAKKELVKNGSKNILDTFATYIKKNCVRDIPPTPEVCFDMNQAVEASGCIPIYRMTSFPSATSRLYGFITPEGKTIYPTIGIKDGFIQLRDLVKWASENK